MLILSITAVPRKFWLICVCSQNRTTHNKIQSPRCLIRSWNRVGVKGFGYRIGPVSVLLGLVCSFGFLRIPGFCPHTMGLALSFTVSMSREIVLSWLMHTGKDIITTEYRLFSQHLGGTGKHRFGSVPQCSFTDCLFLTSHLFPTTPPSISRFMFYFPHSPFYDEFSPIFYGKHEGQYSTIPPVQSVRISNKYIMWFPPRVY